jgi:transposase
LLKNEGVTVFVRVKRDKDSERRRVQVVENTRIGFKIKQKIIRHVGIAYTDMEEQKMRDLGEFIVANEKSKSESLIFDPETLAEMAIQARKHPQKDELHVDLKKLKEEQRVVLGVHEVLGEVYNTLGFNKLLGARRKSSEQNLFHITMARLANPASKRAAVQDLAQDFGTQINLSSVYRMMDHLDEKVIDKSRMLAYESATKLFGEKLELVFYDCTTLYFESFSEDDLRCSGFSKDLKFSQPQIVMGLVATSEGLPIDYEVFPGNTFEGNTVERAIDQIRTKYNIDKVVFVADSAMIKIPNQAYFEKNGLHYIIAARMRNMSDGWKEKILTPVNEFARTENTDSTTYDRIREWDYSGTWKNPETKEKVDLSRRLIVTYSEKRARKDKHDRDNGVAKLRKKLKDNKNLKSYLSNSGYKRFLEVENDTDLMLNEEKIEKAARWDGLHGVVTNIPAGQMSMEDVANRYREQWQIEECFRISKHDLRMRPVFHWTPQRVRAHIMICFVALVCIRHLAYRVKLRYEPMSSARIIRELKTIQASILRHQETNTRYVVPSSVSKDAKMIYTTMALKTGTTPYEMPTS